MYGTLDPTSLMETKNQYVTAVTDDLPRQLRQDALTRLIAVLINIETANSDDSGSAVWISRSDFKLIRYLVDICAQQARIGSALDQLIHDKDQQLQTTRTELEACRRNLGKLNRMTDTAGVAASPVVAPDAVTTAVSLSKITFPTSAELFSSRLPRSDPEANMGCSNEAVQNSGRWHHRKATFNVESEFASDCGGSKERKLADSAVPETGAPCHVTSAREYTDKVVQQNVRLKRILGHFISQRYGSVEEFLASIYNTFSEKCYGKGINWAFSIRVTTVTFCMNAQRRK